VQLPHWSPSVGSSKPKRARAEVINDIKHAQQYRLESPSSCCHYYVLFRYTGALPPSTSIDSTLYTLNGAEKAVQLDFPSFSSLQCAHHYTRLHCRPLVASQYSSPTLIRPIQFGMILCNE
jgi:hypothetical protein